ncbi:hypothetical protein Tco_1193952 [Tanacetum coccineum]
MELQDKNGTSDADDLSRPAGLRPHPHYLSGPSGNSFEDLNVENLIIGEAATGGDATTFGKLVLVDDNGKPLEKVDYLDNLGGDIEVEPDDDNETESFLASKAIRVRHGLKCLLEQWRENEVDGDYEPYYNDMYEGHEILDNIQTICDNLDIKVHGLLPVRASSRPLIPTSPKNGGEQVGNEHVNEFPLSYATRLSPTSLTKANLHKLANVPNDANYNVLEVKLVFVDDDKKPLEKVDYLDNSGSDDEVEPDDNETTSFLASKVMGVGHGPKCLLEQWRENKLDYDYEPYDDDMYESHEILDYIQTICDNLDIKARGRKKKYITFDVMLSHLLSSQNCTFLMEVVCLCNALRCWIHPHPLY